MNVKLEATKHFKDRCKTRLGISKKDALGYFYKAYYNGLRYGDFKNALFCKYLSQLTRDCEPGIEAIVINHYIIIAKNTGHNTCLAITILHVPSKYLYIVDRVMERRHHKHGKNSRKGNARKTNRAAS